MKIVIFEAEPRETPAFEALKAHHDVVLEPHPLRADNVGSFADAEIVSVFVYSALNEEVFRKLPALKLVATRSTGYDHIDAAYCAAHSILLCNVPTYGENTVAEHVFALLLAISHRLPEAIGRARSGHFSPEGLQGFDLQGKTLGVIGTGNIGRHVIRIAKGFDMDVLAFDVHPDHDFAARMGFRYGAMDELLAQSDVISLHVPATPQTHHLIDADAFRLMKHGVIIINTARGTVVDTLALIEALQSGKVGGAGLDVLPDEPLIREEAQLISSFFRNQHDLRNLVANHVLLHMPNVVITPHSAFNTREAIARIVKTTVENIEAFLAGHPQNVVGK